MPELIKLDNPFRKYQRQIIQVKPGETVEQILERELRDKEFECELITFINNQEITESERSKRILSEGEFLYVAPKVAGDDAGKSILNIVIMVATFGFGNLVAQAMWLGPMATVGMKVAFMVGGAMLVSALTPAPKIPSSGFIDDEQSQSFGWNPVTVQRQGIAISRAYGLNKMYGNVIAAHTEKEAITYEETTIAEKFYYDKAHSLLQRAMGYYQDVQVINEFDPRKVNLYSLFNIGVGPVREPVISGTLKLNDQLIENLNNVYSESRRGNLRQQQISYFDSTILEVVVNRLVVNGTPINYTTQNGNFNDLEIELSFPRGLFDGIGVDLANNTVNVSVEIKKTTDTTWTFLANNVAITDNVGDKVIETYTTVGVFTVDYGSNYDIRITKVTVERDNIRYGDDLFLDKVREIIDQQFTYPRRALVGIKALATNQLSGSIRFSCLSRGLYVRQYSNSLGGAIGYSNNPADVIADILTQPVYTGEHSPWLDLTLLLNFNGADAAVTTLDESERGHTVNFTATAQLDDAQKKFGVTSLWLDGNSDDVNIANDNYSFDICENAVEDWTIDFFVRFTDHVGTEYLITQYEDANNRWYIRNIHGDTIAFVLRYGGADIFALEAPAIADNNWHHVAICKVGSTYGIYLDENQIDYKSDSSTDTFDGDLFIGQKGDDTSWFEGHIDHVRIIKQNIFGAAPNVGETDTITEPAAEFTDPGNSYAVSRYDGYNPTKLLTADFEELADWCDDAEINPVNFGIKSISQATNAVIETTNINNLKVGETVLFRGVATAGMVELVDETTATILKVTDNTTFTIDLDTSAFNAYTGAEPLLLVHFDGVAGSTSFTDEIGTHTITTIGDTEVSGTKKFGSGSGYFPGSDDGLSIPDHADWDLVASNLDNWTVDFWVKEVQNSATHPYLVTQIEDADNFWLIYYDKFQGFSFHLFVGGISKILSTHAGLIGDNDFHHVALCKVANEYALYLDGVQISYNQSDETATFAGKLFLGVYNVGAVYVHELQGYMDELCIVDSNRFSAAPNAGLSDTIVVPTVPLIVGVGTVEKYQPRFSFNGIFDTETNMWEAALSVCELCRCVPFWDGDIIRLAIDKAGSSVYAFTMGNILKNTFKQKFISMAERAGEIEVHYRDAAKDYTRMPFTLVNDDIGNTTSKTRLDLFGITDTDMANRLAEFKLLQNLNLKKIVIIETEIESIACTIGDIVDVQHDITNWGSIGSGDDAYTGGGRIVSATNETNAVITIGGEIYFDDADWQEGSTTYKLLIKTADDSAPESKVITGITESSIAGGTFDITVSGVYTTYPKRDDIWAAGEEDLETNKYRILDIRRTEKGRAEITMIEYNSDVYAND